MVDKDTLFENLYKGSELEKYAKYFYYGFDDGWNGQPISKMCEGLWGNDDTINALNKFEEYYHQGRVKTIYLDDTKKDINLTIVNHKEVSKFVLICAGGGYSSVATAVEGLPIGEYLYQKGFSVGYLTYSINKDARNDGSYNDLIKAIKYLVSHEDELNINMNNFIIGGCSAGAHLVARYGTNNCGYMKLNMPKPALMFLGYPVIDCGKFTHPGSAYQLLGDNPKQEDIDRLSIQKNVDNNFPPVFLWQCQRDNVVPFKNSLLMDEALTKANVKHIYKTYDSDAHGWGLATGKLAEGWVDEMLEFYKTVIK